MLKEIIKELLIEEINGKKTQEIKSETLASKMYGKHVMVRTYSAGVHFGTLEKKNGQEILLKDAKRVHYWEGACSLSQLAMESSKKLDNCRISMAVDTIILDQVIEIILMPDNAYNHLFGAKEWKI